MVELDYNEADTRRIFITPKIIEAGWDILPASFTAERTFTDGRIVVTGGRVRRGKQKIADYVLRYRSYFPIAVVEAKQYGDPAAKGLQQAKDYAEILGLKFAYSTNGREIIEFNYLTGSRRRSTAFRHRMNYGNGSAGMKRSALKLPPQCFNRPGANEASRCATIRRSPSIARCRQSRRDSGVSC